MFGLPTLDVPALEGDQPLAGSETIGKISDFVGELLFGLSLLSYNIFRVQTVYTLRPDEDESIAYS